MDLQGKVAVVTGSGQGLGRAYALGLAHAGARVVVNDIDAENARKLVADIRRDGGEAVAEVGAVGATEVAERIVRRAVEAYGHLDVFVANAGILRDSVVWKMTDDDFDKVIEVHLRGTFTCVRAASNVMREQGAGGRIICVGSPTGQQGLFGQSNYAAAKAGIVGMVRTWAMELQKAGVTVNAIVPVAATGMTETVPFLAPYAAALQAGEALPAKVRRGLGFGSPEDVAGLVTFLASDAASYITGQAIGIGGDRVTVWSHPTEVVTAVTDEGWSADDLHDVWDDLLRHHLQSVGDPKLQRKA
ncbi:SDR family NAD(P)-dependent oxidoreductase [Nocardia sp. NBC_01329]|uniref:SDR family NAD(P)-dependent oxidoreductase n=1 Tax=Nocardia sp. NBC_01329 TaxID=2903594 RepID=UPI002E148B1B|nr:SDR family oxidoreductase [Nocardia sp. NBC_01329]